MPSSRRVKADQLELPERAQRDAAFHRIQPVRIRNHDRKLRTFHQFVQHGVEARPPVMKAAEEQDAAAFADPFRVGGVSQPELLRECRGADEKETQFLPPLPRQLFAERCGGAGDVFRVRLDSGRVQPGGDFSGGVRAVVGQKEKWRPVPAQERDELRGAGKRFIAEQQRPVEVEQHRVEPGRVPAEKVEKSHGNKIPTEFGMFIRVK